VRAVAALSLVGAVCAALGGVIFWAAQGGTTLTRSIAYGCWFAATVALILAVVSGRSLIWTRTDLPVVESWVFVTAAFVLTATGAAVDVVGTL
jgi:hypothetical protein